MGTSTRRHSLSPPGIWSGCLALVLVLSACSPAPVRNASGSRVQDIAVGDRGPVAGVGIEAHDIAAMTDAMMRDMLQVPALAGRSEPPRVIVDDGYFHNEGSQPINKKLIVSRLRTNLIRASQGRMRFIGRQDIAAVEAERALKREGVTDTGTIGLTRATAGADFRLVGTIATLDTYSGSSGLQQRYTQITFEMIDLEYGELVWSNNYEFQRAAADDVIYR